MKTLFSLVNIFIKMDARNRAFIIPSFIFPMLMITLMSVAGKADGARGDISYASFLTPGVLGMAYAAVTLVGLPVMISSYREKGILRLFKSSKIPMSIVAAAIFITQLFFMFLQTVVLLAYSMLFLDARFSFSANSYLSFPVVVVGLLALLALGFLVSAFLSNTRSATMVGNLLNLLTIFLGGVFFPTTVWPQFLQPLTWVNPLTWITESLRKSFLYETMSTHSFLIEMGALAAILVVCTIAGLKLFKYE